MSKSTEPSSARPWKAAARPEQRQEGRAVIGNYELLKPIGRGATGTVYLARKEGSDREVAVKVLHGGGGPETHERFTREVAVARRLIHRHMVRVLDAGEDDGVPYLVMEMLRGQSLRELLTNSKGGIDVATGVDLVVQLCVGLHHAHEQGLVHRDVKPANVFLTEEGVVKILDFGVAKLTDSTMTADGSLVGTLAYMAPEQLTGGSDIDGRADVFSAGVMLYELLTGRRPFAADSPAAIVARITSDNAPLPAKLPEPIASLPDLDGMLRKALDKDPGRRYETAQDFAHALLRMLLAPRAAVAPRPPVLNETLYAEQVGEVLPQTLVVPQPVAGSGRSTRIYSWVAAVAVVILAAVVGTVIYNKVASASPSANGGTTITLPGADGAGPAIDKPKPPPPPPPPTTAEVLFESTPAGASVLRDGKTLGQTPITLTVSVDQELRVEDTGYESKEVRIDSAALAAGRIAVSLTALQRVRLRATGAYPFEVVVGSRTVSAMAMSHEVMVYAGQSVRLRSRDYLLDQTVRVGRSAIEVEAATLGTLEVRSRYQTCPVIIGGRDFGTLPLKVRVAAGDYNVEMRCPDGRNGRARASVPAGGSFTARVESVR